VFLYTDSEPGAQAVGELAASLLSAHDLPGTVTLSRWHPLEERRTTPPNRFRRHPMP
jgi:hypothetical protein